MNYYDKIRMIKLFEYVKDNVQYYSSLIPIVNSENIEDIYNSLPFQTKSKMRGNTNYLSTEFLSKKVPIISKLTGGTTGEPWLITKTMKENISYFRALWDSRKQFGIYPKDRFYQFGGYGDIDGDYKTQQIIVTEHFTEFSLFNLTDSILDSYIDIILRNDAKWFFANPSALYLLAIRMKQRGIVGYSGIEYIELTGERVYKFQEDLFKEVFNCPISIMYGSREISTISHRCKYGNNHILPNIYIETYDENLKKIKCDSKTKGELVITSFVDHYMPFIKYRTGDYGIIKEIEDCPCGRKGFVIEDLVGREGAFIEIAGKKINLEIGFYLMEKCNRNIGNVIKQFEIHFKNPNYLFFNISLVNNKYNLDVINFYENELKNILPEAIISINIVDDIPRKKKKMCTYIIEKD